MRTSRQIRRVAMNGDRFTLNIRRVAIHGDRSADTHYAQLGAIFLLCTAIMQRCTVIAPRLIYSNFTP